MTDRMTAGQRRLTVEMDPVQLQGDINVSSMSSSPQMRQLALLPPPPHSGAAAAAAGGNRLRPAECVGDNADVDKEPPEGAAAATDTVTAASDSTDPALGSNGTSSKSSMSTHRAVRSNGPPFLHKLCEHQFHAQCDAQKVPSYTCHCVVMRVLPLRSAGRAAGGSGSVGEGAANVMCCRGVDKHQTHNENPASPDGNMRRLQAVTSGATRVYVQ